jgi:hypothetical protein
MFNYKLQKKIYIRNFSVLKDILIELASELKEFGSYFESNKKQIETFFRLSLARSRDLIGLFLFLPTNEFK